MPSFTTEENKGRAWVYTYETYMARKRAVYAAGERPLAGPICRDCLRLVPRPTDAAERWDVPEKMWCRCGHMTSTADDFAAHGFVPEEQWMSFAELRVTEGSTGAALESETGSSS